MAYKLIRKDFFRRNALLFQEKNLIKRIYRNCSTLAQAEVVEIKSIYPPIKPKYPPGQWKRISAASAWQIHDLSHTALTYPQAKKRLDFLAGDVPKTLWLMDALSPRPNNLDFQKILTKTEILHEQPTDVTNISNEHLIESFYTLAKSLYEECNGNIINGNNKVKNEIEDDTERRTLHDFVGNFLKGAVSLLSDREYLRRSEIDQNVRVESFWRVIGFEGDKSCDGTWDIIKNAEDADCGVVQFQYRHKADFQIRAENPLPEFLSINDPHCSVKETRLPEYGPDTVNFKTIKDRPMNVPGHWVGSPCEFTSGSVHVMPTEYVEEYEKYGMKYLEESEVHMAMTSMFGSCVAQAQNQGFCDVLDVTYPFTTQCVIINKHHVRFGHYQMNTFQLWNDGNTLQNVMWISDPIKLLEETEDGTKQLNKKFIDGFLKFLLLEPKNRGVNLRPYLPEDQAPSATDKMINFKGEEPLPHYVPGRLEYSKYSLYY